MPLGGGKEEVAPLSISSTSLEHYGAFVAVELG
jgi:hypothetical protein